MRITLTGWTRALLLLSAAAAGVAGVAQAATITSVSPRGEVAQVRQLTMARQQWRAAIDIARAVVETRDTPEARDAYNRLRDQHGFRLRETKIDSDATRPRACFVFTEGSRNVRHPGVETSQKVFGQPLSYRQAELQSR